MRTEFTIISKGKTNILRKQLLLLMDMYPLAGTSTNAKLWLLKTSKAALYIAETYCVTQQIFG
jgi:hypothetical protein